MQDLLAIAVAIATALWLARSLAKRFWSPPCQPPGGSFGGDGFVPLGDLAASAKKPGRSVERPGS